MPGRRIVARVNRWFRRTEGSHPSASFVGSPTGKRRPGTGP
jgi:hypothetical protein